VEASRSFDEQREAGNDHQGLRRAPNAREEKGH
jgi:hypothetical protein